jgi:hypothetical protein
VEGATHSAEPGPITALTTRSQKEGWNVEKTLVIVFHDESKAYGGSYAMEGLEEHGDATLDELAIIVKHADGSACVENIERSRGLRRTITGGTRGTSRTSRRTRWCCHRSKRGRRDGDSRAQRALL